MIRRPFRSAFLLVVLLWGPAVFGLAACAPPPPPVPPAGTLARLAVEDVFTVGYAGIQDRYIEPLTLGPLVTEGLRGLGVIDPALTVTEDRDGLSVALDDTPVGRYARPLEDSPRAWAILTTQVILDAREQSPDMRRASAEKLYQAVFDGALSGLDLFSRYAGVEEATRHRDKRDGYYGIGADVGTDAGGSMIARVKAGGPADRAGLVPGDRILAVDGHAVDGLRPHAVARRLHGTPHSRVALKVVAAADGAAPRDLTLVRDLIVPETVHAKRVGRVLVLTIDSFNQETAESLALALIAALDGPVPPRSLILDLRGNPGGLLREAVAVADEFLTQGTIIATRGRHPDSYQFYDADAVALAAGLPMAVLVDGRSASAAEVVAAALQDRGRAVVVGTRSFGKGTVQTVIGLPNDGEITLTWSRLQAPSGYLLHGLGVMPTVCVGADDPSADATISRALAHRAATGATLAAWRTGPADAAERRRLRAQCPPVTAKDDRSLAVALHLLRHPRTHRRALSLADQVTAAR